MKAFKKVLAVSFAAIAVLGIAALASAKPTAPKTVTVMLYKEKASAPANRWVADEATTVIPFKNLRWDAKVVDISVNNKKTSVDARAVGAYELCIHKGPYAKPKDTSVIKFYVKQKDKNGDLEYTKFKVTVKYMPAISPLKSFVLQGTYKDENGKDRAFAKNFAGDFKNGGATVRTVDYTTPCFVGVGTVLCGPDDFESDYYTALKMYACLSCGKEIRIYNKSTYDLSKFCYIKITYQTNAEKYKFFSNKYNDGWNYYKAPNDSFKGTKRFPNTKSLVINFK
jgi:hypothetical protein